VDSKLVDNGALLAAFGGKAAQLGVLVAGKGGVLHQIVFALQFEKACEIIG
jgi:hypothetical protein